MKKVFSLILYGFLVLGITGCRNNDIVSEKESNTFNNSVQENSNTEKKEQILSCSGDYLFTWGFMIGKGQTIDGVQNISYAFDNTDGIGKGEYKFTFKNDKLINMNSIETLSSSYSNQISDSDFNIDGCEINRNSDKRVVIKCNYNENSDTVLALNTDANTPDKLKDILEKNTTLSCK